MSLTATMTLHWYVPSPAAISPAMRPRRARQGRTDARLLSCRQVDALYRLRKGTAAAAFRAGSLPGRERGRAIYVSAKRAQELYGTP